MTHTMRKGGTMRASIWKTGTYKIKTERLPWQYGTMIWSLCTEPRTRTLRLITFSPLRDGIEAARILSRRSVHTPYINLRGPLNPSLAWALNFKHTYIFYIYYSYTQWNILYHLYIHFNITFILYTICYAFKIQYITSEI